MVFDRPTSGLDRHTRVINVLIGILVLGFEATFRIMWAMAVDAACVIFEAREWETPRLARYQMVSSRYGRALIRPSAL